MTETEIIASPEIQEDSSPIIVSEITRPLADTQMSFTEKMNLEDSKIVAPAVETAAVDPVVDSEKPVVGNAVETDFYPELEKKFGRKFDEEALATDWRSKAQENEKIISETKGKLESVKHIFENTDLLMIADLMQKGLTPKDILESMAINPSDVPMESKIIDFVKRENPYLKTDEDVELFAKTNFGYGEDLDSLKEFDAERYFKVIKNIENAIESQDKFLNEKKVQLLNKPTNTAGDNSLVTEQQILTYKDTLNKHIDSLSDFQVNEQFSKPFSKDDLKLISDNIAFSGEIDGSKVVILKDVDDKDVLEAMYLHKNKSTLLNDFKTSFEKTVIEKKSIEAFKALSDKFDNVQGNNLQTDTVEAQPIVITPVRTNLSGGL